MKETYQKVKQYLKFLAEAIRDGYEQDVSGLDFKQMYERRKFGDGFPRPLEGLEAKL